ncbi:MAG TPA: hypothetical protein P5079_04295 [Elusimicrobiota bacterium]|nr:hypothetical protein [Elusimicrobiota bacterium]
MDSESLNEKPPEPPAEEKTPRGMSFTKTEAELFILLLIVLGVGVIAVLKGYLEHRSRPVPAHPQMTVSEEAFPPEKPVAEVPVKPKKAEEHRVVIDGEDLELPSRDVRLEPAPEKKKPKEPAEEHEITFE